MKILQSTHEDTEAIMRLYDAGTDHQKKVAKKHWQGFEKSLVEKEIGEQNQWKIVIDGEIACVFATAFCDPFIWQEKDEDPAVYLHRIATNPQFRGMHFVKHIVAWTKEYALQNGKAYIRMDTGSGNDKLNNYYVSCGFTYLGVTEYPVTDQLPEHYNDGCSSLFEINLN
ncbi:GNAT family N-acetyltransferase [Mucilaginibacter sp. SP1R1]|uniref:GNAT family N-acetyltransferase n=1 Tax=Mucilaginibacter sp. SP1R1 TaxID=2723091 RepID=UPI0016119E3A|nr:GNAT family N-acetyltransferase [Mucilaginibacter sp. SP1R1]MBB6147978.1 ribosomal protein S18 acetylase RimI-like enzyme [Mucilaginibacter sp. SP1R1]